MGGMPFSPIRGGGAFRQFVSLRDSRNLIYGDIPTVRDNDVERRVRGFHGKLRDLSLGGIRRYSRLRFRVNGDLEIPLRRSDRGL